MLKYNVIESQDIELRDINIENEGVEGNIKDNEIDSAKVIWFKTYNKYQNQNNEIEKNSKEEKLINEGNKKIF